MFSSMEVSSGVMISGLLSQPRRYWRDFSASERRPCSRSQRGVSGRKGSPMMKIRAGMNCNAMEKRQP